MMTIMLTTTISSITEKPESDRVSRLLLYFMRSMFWLKSREKNNSDNSGDTQFNIVGMQNRFQKYFTLFNVRNQQFDLSFLYCIFRLE